MQGQRDIPLNDKGLIQAAGNGRTLAAFLQQEGIEAPTLDFVSSPLKRTRQTMEMVRKNMGLSTDDYRTDDRLKEITFGTWEGQTLEELQMTRPDLTAARRADKWGFICPEGESYEMLSRRILGWLSSVDKPTVAVTHGGVIRVLRGLLQDLDPRHIPSLDVPQDTVYVWRNNNLTALKQDHDELFASLPDASQVEATRP